MNDSRFLYGNELKQILRDVLDKKLPISMSFLVDGNWSVARALITEIREDNFDIKITPRKRSQYTGLKTSQAIGISFKCGYGLGYDKFIFDAVVIGFKSSPASAVDETIVLAIPAEIEKIQKRSFLRVSVPSFLTVDVQLWSYEDLKNSNTNAPFIKGSLIDISAGGIQVGIDASRKNKFEIGRFLRLRFSPLPQETPLMFNAQIRSIAVTVDGSGICLGLRMIGLEASPEGRLILQRLCNIVEQYQQLNQLHGVKKSSSDIEVRTNPNLDF